MGHPTLLAQLAAQRHWTSRVAAKAFADCARELGFTTLTVSERSWERWCSGQLGRTPRPTNCQVLERMFGQPVRELLAPPLALAPAVAGLSSGFPQDTSYRAYQDRLGARPSQIDEEVAVVADESARFARSVRRIDEHALDQFEADVVRLATDYLRRPVYLSFRRIAQLCGEVFSILDAHHPLEQQRRLYEIAGRLSALQAHANADLGHPREAETHARTALICAELESFNSWGYRLCLGGDWPVGCGRVSLGGCGMARAAG